MKKTAKTIIPFAVGFLVISALIANYGSTDYTQSDEKHFNTNSTTPTPTPPPPLPTISPTTKFPY